MNLADLLILAVVAVAVAAVFVDLIYRVEARMSDCPYDGEEEL